MLYWQILEILAARGVAEPRDDRFELRDDSDGKGPRITKWDKATLGPKPKAADLAAVAAAAEAREAASAARPRRNVLQEIDQIKARLDAAGIA